MTVFFGTPCSYLQINSLKFFKLGLKLDHGLLLPAFIIVVLDEFLVHPGGHIPPKQEPLFVGVCEFLKF